MHYHGPIIRPQTDADSLFLEVTAGCTHNSCAFCSFYKDTPFWIAPLSQIEEDLEEAEAALPDVRDIWLSGGNPYALSTDRLEEIGKLVRAYYPKARVSTYAIVNDIVRKSVDEIRRLMPYIDEIMIGIETGDDEALAFMNKGYTSADIIEAGTKLDEAGQKYRMIYLGGLAGAGKLEESAKKSAAVFNQIHPYYMILTNVVVLPGTRLQKDREAGRFQEASELERLKEIRTLAAGLKNEITIDTGTSASSICFAAHLPDDREKLLSGLDQVISHFSAQEERALHDRRESMKYV